MTVSSLWKLLRERVSCLRKPRALEHISPEDGYPEFPPPSPEELLKNRKSYEDLLLCRKWAAPRGCYEDTPLFALYRIYEYLVLNHTTGMRNEIEFFSNRHQWAVSAIPDPQDDNPSRYAVLACIPQLLVNAFNRNIADGLPRDAPAIKSAKDFEELKAREKRYESMPEWTRNVKPLPCTLKIPHENDEVLPGFDDPRASPAFLEKNILIWEPHYYFT